MTEHPNPTDEELVAYVDGELDPAAHARIAALARRPDVALRLAEFSRSRAALRSAGESRPRFDGPLPEGIADAARRLAAALEARAAAVGEQGARAVEERAADARVAPNASAPRVQDDFATADRVVSIASRTPRARPAWRRWTGVGAALAASVTLVVAVVLTRGASAPGELLAVEAGASIAPGHPLYEAFERAPSATTVTLDGAVARPWLTFRATSGVPCREMEVSAGSVGTLALACREAAAWRVVAAEQGLARTAGGDAAFVPAAAPVSERVAAEVDRLIAGDPLSADEEARLLAAGWE